MFVFIKKNTRFLFFILLFVLTLYLFRGSVLNSDDIYYNFLDSEHIKLTKSFFYGTWIMTVQNLFMYYIPSKLDISLQTWALTFGVLFKTIIMTVIFYVLSKFLSRDTTNTLFFVALGILYFLCFTLFNVVYSIDLLLYSGFFRFIVPSALGVIYFYILLKVHKNECINLFPFLTFVVLSVASSELMFPICISSSLILLFFEVLSFFKNGYFENKRKVQSIFLIFLASLLGFSLLFFSFGFQQHLNDKINFSNNLYFQTSGLIPFFILFLKKLVYNFSYIYILIFSLCFFYKFSSFNQEKKQDLFFSLIPFASVYLSAFTFFFAGRTSYSGGFWIEHNDIYSFYIPIMLVSVVILLRIFLEEKLISNLKKVIISFLFLFFLLLPFYISVDNIRFAINSIQKYSYLRDKILLFYHYKGEKPFISELCLNRKAWVLLGLFPMPESDQNKKQFIATLENYYLPISYKLKTKMIYDEYKLISHSSLIEKFISDGGSIAEIEKNVFNFENLKDETFVLN